MRYKFLRWLRELANVPDGAIAPRWIYAIYYLLFPLNFFYEKQSGIKYDALTDVYTIKGMRFTGSVFHMLSDDASIGAIVEITDVFSKDGTKCATIRKIDIGRVTIKADDLRMVFDNRKN